MNHRQWPTHLPTRLIVASGILGFALSGSCVADTVFMKDGSEIEGTVLESDNNTVVIKQLNGTTRSFRRGDVDTIVKSAKISVSAAPVQVAPEPAPVQVTPAQPAVPANPAVPAPNNVVPAAPAVPATGTAPAAPETVQPNPGTVPAPVPAPGTAPADPNNPGAVPAPNPDPNAPPGAPAPGATATTADTWTPPPNLASFPDHAKRLPADKEAIFMSALENLGQLNAPDVVDKARNDIQSLGKEALPYVVAGIQHINVETRAECMKMIPSMDGQRAVKQVIEALFAAIPDSGRPASYQVPYLDAIKSTLSSITGQSFITGQVKDSQIQDASKAYIDWYNANLMTLPPQMGEKKISETDPDFIKKVTEARQLKLAKRSWPVPAQPADEMDANKTNDRPALNEATTQRAADRDWQKDAIKKIDRNDALKRPQDQ